MTRFFDAAGAVDDAGDGAGAGGTGTGDSGDAGADDVECHLFLPRKDVTFSRMTLELLKEEIVALSDEERQALAVWLNGLDSDAWDYEMARDFSPGGRGEHLLDKVKADIAAGKFGRVEEFYDNEPLNSK